MANTLTPVSRLLERLAVLRGRIRRIVAVSGASRWLLLAVAAAAAFFFADWGLDLPLSVRRFVRLGLLDQPTWLSAAPTYLLLGASILLTVLAARGGHRVAALFAFAAGGLSGVLVWAAARLFIEPLRIPLSDQDLALSVEERFRHLNDRLVAALDFDRELANPTRGESPAMMASVVAEATREAEGLEFKSLASGKHAMKRAGVAGLAVAVAAGLALLAPEAVSLWARRSLMVEDVAWPKSTKIEAVVQLDGGAEGQAGRLVPKDPKVPYTVALGQSLRILAQATGKIPSEVTLFDRLPEDGPESKPLPHRMRAIAGHDGLFEVDIVNVRSAFRFHVRGGDDQDDIPSYSVVVRVPPRVLSVRASLTYPAYLKLPPRMVDGGSFEVFEGTEAKVSFETDTDIAGVEATLGEKPVRVDGGPRSFGFGFTAEKPFRWKLKLTTKDGRENDPAADTYEVDVKADEPPHPEWVYPRGPLEATPNARLPLFLRTHDDHGIASLTLEARIGSGTPVVSIPLLPRGVGSESAANDAPFGSDTILSYLPLEVSTLKDATGKPPGAPARLSMRLVAVDTKGQTGEGEWTTADLLRSDELERSLAGRRTTIKSDLLGVRVELAKIRQEVSLLSGGAIGDGERGSLREIQFKQGKIRSDVDRGVRSLLNLFNAYVYNRLGAEVPTEKVLSILDGRHRAIFSRTLAGGEGPSKEGGEVQAPPEGETAVFPYAMYRKIIEARRDRTVFDTGILDKILSVLEAAVDCADVLAPAASALAAEAASKGTAAELVSLVAAEDRLLARLKDTLDAMADWQNLNELILALRRLIEEQEALHGQIKALPDKNEPKESPPK